MIETHNNSERRIGRKTLIGFVAFVLVTLGSLPIILFSLTRESQDIRSRAQVSTSIATHSPTSVPSPTPISTSVPFSTPRPSSNQNNFVLSRFDGYTIYGYVYIDTNNDGLFNNNEQGYSGAEVKLTGGTSLTLLTMANGAYGFGDLKASIYTITVNPPTGYEISTASLTNFYVSLNKRHDIGLRLASASSSSSSSSSSSTSTPTPAPTPQQAAYYVSPTGSDSANGSSAAPFKTIQKAVNTTKTDSDPGAIIHVLPGTYRESVSIASVTGTSLSPVEIKAENGANTVYVVGSQSSQDTSITWTQSDGGLSFPTGVASHIYRADISSWGATPELAYHNTSTVTRLPKAHEPDFGVTTSWKYHQNWWKADGISGTSHNSLVDTTDDVEDSYPEATANAGNISNINGFTTDFLAGARIFAKDTYDGHDSLTATISAHTASTGTLTFSTDLDYYNDSPAIGQYAKYYIEGKPQLLDQEGEWYYDSSTHYLYIWPPGDVNPNTLSLEFATRNTGFSISKSSYVTLKDLNVQFTNYAYSGVTGPDGAIRFFGFTNDTTNNITLDGLRVMYNGVGLRLYQSNALSTSPGMLSYVTVKNSTINYTDSYGMVVWPFPRTPPQSPVINHLWLENNDFGYMGFRGDGEGIFMQHPEKVVAINNYFHDASHNTVHIQQGKATGNSYVYFANNFFDAGCLNGSDCGALKLLHSDGGTGSDVNFITRNIFRGTKGWSYAAEAQSADNSPFGYGYNGFGYYSDVEYGTSPSQGCSIILYRNIAQGNSADGIHYTRSRNQCAFNNVLTQNGNGIKMNNFSPTTDGSFGNIIRGNIIQHTESGNATNANIYGIVARLNQSDEDELEVDRNIYQMSGTHTFDMFKQDIAFTHVGTFTTTADIRSNTPWEDNGLDVTGKTVGINSEDHYEISAIEAAFGENFVDFPAEATATIQALESEYGIDITNVSTVGRIP